MKTIKGETVEKRRKLGLRQFEMMQLSKITDTNLGKCNGNDGHSRQH